MKLTIAERTVSYPYPSMQSTEHFFIEQYSTSQSSKRPLHFIFNPGRTAIDVDSDAMLVRALVVTMGIVGRGSGEFGVVVSVVAMGGVAVEVVVNSGSGSTGGSPVVVVLSRKGVVVVQISVLICPPGSVVVGKSVVNESSVVVSG